MARQTFMVQKKPIKVDSKVDNIVISELVETKTNCKYLILHLDKVIRPLIFILPKMSGYEQSVEVFPYG